MKLTGFCLLVPAVISEIVFCGVVFLGEFPLEISVRVELVFGDVGVLPMIKTLSAGLLNLGNGSNLMVLLPCNITCDSTRTFLLESSGCVTAAGGLNGTTLGSCFITTVDAFCGPDTFALEVSGLAAGGLGAASAAALTTAFGGVFSVRFSDDSNKKDDQFHITRIYNLVETLIFNEKKVGSVGNRTRVSRCKG